MPTTDIPDSDSATLTDDARVVVAVRGTDSGIATDAVGNRTASGVDSATLTDTGVKTLVTVSKTDSDSATLTDTTGIIGLGKFGTETFTLTDTAAIANGTRDIAVEEAISFFDSAANPITGDGTAVPNTTPGATPSSTPVNGGAGLFMLTQSGITIEKVATPSIVSLVLEHGTVSHVPNPPSSPPPSSTVVLSLSPLLFWRLAETSGTTAADASGNSRTGTYTTGTNSAFVLGVTSPIVSDAADKAVTITSVAPGFDAGYVISAASTAFDTASMTVNVWIKPDSGRTQKHGIAAVMDGSATRWYIRAQPIAGTLEIFNSAVSFITSVAVTFNVWQMLTLTFDASDSKYRIYQNGVLTYTSGASSLGAVTNRPFAIGHNNGPSGGSETFAGSIDDVALFGTALDAATIAEMYAAATAAAPPATPTGPGTSGTPGDVTAWLPPGLVPLSDATAASLVTHVAEYASKTANTAANAYVPSAAELAAYLATPDDNGDLPAQYNRYFGFVTGRHGLTAPSTDDLIQWASHKWGIPTDWIRAEAVDETGWRQDGTGDRETVSPADYALHPAVAQIAPFDVYESLGIMQIKWRPDGSRAAGTEPLRWKSTAFCLDYYGATIRYYFDGMCVWCTPGYTPLQQWPSIGAWFNPSPWNATDAQAYTANVRAILSRRDWESY